MKIALPDTPEARRMVLDSLKSPRGGYTRKTIESLGIAWPPKTPWRKNLIEFGYVPETKESLKSLTETELKTIKALLAEIIKIIEG